MKKSVRIFLLLLSFVLVFAASFGFMTYGKLSYLQGDYIIEKETSSFENSNFFENSYSDILTNLLWDVQENLISSNEINEDNQKEINDKNYPFQIKIKDLNNEIIVDTIDEDIKNDKSLIINYNFTTNTITTNLKDKDLYNSIFTREVNNELKNKVSTIEIVINPDDKENFSYFHNLKILYEKSNENFNVIYLSFLLIPLILITFYLAYMAGRDENGKFNLLIIDKIPLEVVLAFSLLLFFLAIQLIESFIYLITSFGQLYYSYGYFYSGITSFNEIRMMFLLIASGFSFIYFGLLASLLSLSRKIKAGVLIKNSIIYILFSSLVKLIKNIFLSLKETPKLIIAYFGLIFVNMLSFILIFALGSILSILVLLLILALDISVINRLSKYKKEQAIILNTAKDIGMGNKIAKINTEGFYNENIILSNSINNMYDGIQNAVNKSLKSERMRTDLITNVSHDIKTPLTSIINYSDLLMKENFEDTKIKEYVEIINRKSKQLKTMTEDIVDASKASSGALKIENEIINLDELMNQLTAEYEEKFKSSNLELVYDNLSHNQYVLSDGRYLYRVLANLFDNALKYSLENTRVYLSLSNENNKSIIEIKNLSKEQLNISSDDLYQRFVRGDTSRTTSGSGLGLSIAKDLMKLLNGNLDIIIDGDYFKSKVILNTYIKKEENIFNIKDNQ